VTAAKTAPVIRQRARKKILSLRCWQRRPKRAPPTPSTTPSVLTAILTISPFQQQRHQVLQLPHSILH
jgi:hypothetical protein